MVLLILLALTSGVAILLGLMVVGLLEAPWPILLSLLFFGLLGLQRLAAHATAGDDSGEAPVAAQSSLTKAPSAPSESPADDRPTFTYRGIKYRAPATAPRPPADEPTTMTEGIYRGHPWQRTNTDAANQTPPSSESPTELKYRGHQVKK